MLENIKWLWILTAGVCSVGAWWLIFQKGKWLHVEQYMTAC